MPGPENRLASYPRVTARTPFARNAFTVAAASAGSEARRGYDAFDRRPESSSGSPPPTRTTDPRPASTTLVVNRWSGPSADSAAVVVSSFSVDAGVKVPVVA